MNQHDSATNAARLFRSEYDWQYETGGEKNCNGRNIYLQRGKVLGGSSSTNACLYHRGSAMDYDQWNIPGWSSADVLPIFKLIENDATTAMGTSKQFHGTGGDWNLDHVRYQNPLSKRFLEVSATMGLAVNHDFNDWSRPQDGVGRFHVAQKNGERCSGATAFLHKARKRPNLIVRSGAMVRRVQFDSSLPTKTAIGVVYSLVGDDSLESCQAQLNPGGEILLTAGAIGSPQILMCSGIGPARHLRTLGIPIVHDNPNVGDNLQDHPATVVSFKTPQAGVSVTSKLRLFGKSNPFPFLLWLIWKKGLLTSVGCDHGAFVRVTPGALQPDLQLRFIAAKALGPDGMTTYTKFRSMGAVEDGYTIQTIAIRAKSRGKVRLASSNCQVPPIIDLGYLSNPDDLITLREGIKLARIICRRPEWGDYLGEEVYPGPEVQTDEQIEEYIRNTVHSSNALTGTCKMGFHNGDEDAVVGPDLKLLGVNGVRVADSSVIPIIPGGQTATPTVMIAERAAQFILKGQEAYPQLPNTVNTNTEYETLSLPCLPSTVSESIKVSTS
ncbi:hypothetical protein ACA910_010716 [Epithemia clementina (nom. ined.)]